MLGLVGIGLCPKDLSVNAIEFIKSAEAVIMDSYTSIMAKEGVDFIASATGKTIRRMPRTAFEDELWGTVSMAKTATLAILVIGDPLIATTHHIILDEAARQGIPTKVFHAASVFSAAIGESGLDIYKFGPCTTVPYWSEHYKPTSFIDVISRNSKAGQHTLVLLDVNPEGPKPMGIGEAVGIISEAQEKAHTAPIKPGDMVIVMADIGKHSQSIRCGKFSDVAAHEDSLRGKTISIIVPAGLSFAEEEALKRFSLP